MFQPPNNSSTATPTTGTLVEKPSLETVRTAIRTVLSQETGIDRKQASDWLEALKNSIFAWEICDQLLQARESIEVSYLAAHMLRQKILKCFNELPLAYYSSLKDSILNHLQTHNDYAVQGQLTMAIADLALLLQIWQNPIEDLAKQLRLDVSLRSLADTNRADLLKALQNRLIFAYVMHQLCDVNHDRSERPHRIGAKRREEYEDYLISKCSQAITWWLNTSREIDELQNYLFQKSNLQFGDQQTIDENEAAIRAQCLDVMSKLTGQIYLCYSAWLRIFDEENVNQSLPLIDAAFKHLRDSDCSDSIHKYAVEVVVSTAAFCEDEGDANVGYLVTHLVNEVYSLEQAFRDSVEGEDIEKSTNFAKVFTSVGECACYSHVIDKKDFRLIELLLSCLSHYDFEIVEETYAFWYSLLMELQNHLKKAQYEPFVGYINRFIMAVTKLCQFDSDEDSVISPDQEIHNFRNNTASIIGDLMYISNVEDFIRESRILDTLRVDLSNISWEKVEAILYLLNCLIPIMTRDDNALKAQIFNCILAQQTGSINSDTNSLNKQINLRIGISQGEVHPQLVATSLQTIGQLENFLGEHPDHFVLAINYILSSISHSTYRNQLIKYAAKALCSIMELNASRHLTSCPQLLIIVKDLCTSLDQFDEQAVDELLKCAALMADAIDNTNVKDQFLCEIIRPIMNSLQTTLSQKGDETEPTKFLDRLSSVFRQTSIPVAVVPELKNFITMIDLELWPIIVKVLEMYASRRGHAIERTCRTIRYLLRCIKPEWMIQRVAETMINLYKTYPQNSSPLYICSILVDEFANRSPEINQGLFAMLELFCSMTFTLLDLSNSSQTESLLNMKSYPETIDDMMRLFLRFMKKCPNDFVNCKALESIIELSLSSLRIDHPDANERVCKFVSAFVSLAQSQPEFAHIAEGIRKVLGARFTDAVIRACLFDIPTNLIGEEAQVLIALYEFDKDLFSQWVEATIMNLPRTNIQGIESVTTEQLQEFKETITSAGSMKRMVNGMRSFARIYT